MGFLWPIPSRVEGLICMSFEDLTCTKGATGVRSSRDTTGSGCAEPDTPTRRSRMAPGRVLTCLPGHGAALSPRRVPTCARERSTLATHGPRHAPGPQGAGRRLTPTERPDRPPRRGRRGSYGEVSAPRWRSWGSSIAAWTSSAIPSPIPAPIRIRLRLRLVSEPASERTATPAHPDTKNTSRR
jgi:hypothetical protein